MLILIDTDDFIVLQGKKYVALIEDVKKKGHAVLGRRKWTQDERGEVAAMVRQNLSIEQMAKKLNRSPNAVSTYISHWKKENETKSGSKKTG